MKLLACVAFKVSFLLFYCTVWLEMEARIEKRCALKFLVKGGATPMECWNKLHEVYGGDTFTPKTVRVWHKKFLSGVESTKDRKRPGHLQSVRTPETIQKVQDALATERRQTIEEMSEELRVKPTSLHTILKKDL